MADERYGRVFLAWAAGLLGPALVALAVAYVADYSGSGCISFLFDCVTGLDAVLLVAVPFLLLSSLTVAPLAVYVSLRMGHDALAARTAVLSLAVAVPAVVLSAVLFPGGLPVLAAPAVGGRYAALRASRSVGQPT